MWAHLITFAFLFTVLISKFDSIWMTILFLYHNDLWDYLLCNNKNWGLPNLSLDSNSDPYITFLARQKLYTVVHITLKDAFKNSVSLHWFYLYSLKFSLFIKCKGELVFIDD